MGPVWLDLSRTLSRVGRSVGTGIDRVERAYLDHFLHLNDRRTRYVARTTRGVLFFGAAGAKALRDGVDDPTTLPQADLVSRAYGRGASFRHRAEALLRRHRLDRAPGWGIGRLVARQAEAGFTYLSVGHAHLSRRIMEPVKKAGGHVVAMVHDLIPLTHPDTARPDVPAKFATRIETLRQNADLVLCNSRQTECDLAAHWAQAERSPRLEVIPLGVDRPPRPDVVKDPSSFVMLGTIEPRKNHALMLKVWEVLAADMGRDAPVLHIIGPRGWHSPAFFDALKAHPLYGTSIIEHGALPEPEMRLRLASAQALLFPSIAEGYGYPPLEAQMLGTVPIVSDIPTHREVLGDHAVYLPLTDAYPWIETIKKYLSGTLSVPETRADEPPTWMQHFDALHQVLWGEKAKDSR